MSEKLLKTLSNLAHSKSQPEKTAQITALEGQSVTLEGALTGDLQINDMIKFVGADHEASYADIIALSSKKGTALLRPRAGALRIGDVALKQKTAQFTAHGGYLGQIIKPDGQGYYDGQHVPPRPPFDQTAPIVQRSEFGEVLETHHPVFNTLLPIAKGQRLGLFAGSGVGKTSLLRDLVQKIDYDVAVVALVGERSREVQDWHQSLGPEARNKTVIVAAPSSAAALERRLCAFNAMRLAKLYRNTGAHVLYVCDSLTRLAEAHREMSTALGELPVMRGHPPSVVPLLSGLCEEAGNTANGGAITALFTVLVAGSDMEEPVADIARGILDGHVVLDRALAEKGHFPAIDILRSLSRCDTVVLAEEEQEHNARVRKRLKALLENQILLDSGLYQKGQNAQLDMAVHSEHDLNAFLTQKEARSQEWHFEQLKAILNAE